jgi:hypothetical protein
VARGAWMVYRWAIALFFAACVVQIFLAGRGVFGIRGGGSLDDQTSLDPHRALGNLIGILAALLFLLALATRQKRLIGWTLVLLVLAELVQHATALPKHPWVAGLHPVSGVAILGISGWLAHDAWRGSRGDVPGAAG